MKIFPALSLILGFFSQLAVAQPGDIYAVSSGTRSVVKIDPATGEQTVAPPGALATTGGFAVGVAIASNGDLFVTLGERIVRITPSGTQSDLATGFGNPGGIVAEPSGSLLVADLLTHAISRVNSSTGNVVLVSSGDLISGPLGIDLEPDGNIVVTSRNNGRIVRIHPTTGAQSIVSEGGVLGNPQWLAVNSSGDIFVTTGSTVVKVNPVSGAQTVLASGGPLFSTRGIAVNADGDLVLANGNNRILRVNANMGAVTEISPNGGAEFINGSAGLAIVPTPPPAIPVATIAAGSNVMWAVTADGTVAQWQSNVGSVPAGLANVVDLGGGNRFALALRGDGTVAAWGQDPFGSGMLNVPAGLAGVVAVEGGDSHSLALKSDGAVIAWGRAAEGQTAVPAGLVARAIGAGDYHSLAARSDGTVAAWGTNAFGQLNVPAGLSGVIAVDGGSRHSLALKSNGTVVAWGPNFFGETTVPAGLSGVTAIAAGWYHNLALRSDGTVVGWGNNDYGQRTIPAGLNNVVAIAAGAYTSMALRSDGSIVVWGYDPFGSIQPPAGTSFKVPGSPASDTAPPVLSLPAPITVLATGSSGAAVTYSVTATDDTDPAPVVSCSPASGSTFLIGQTTVGCTATDATGNQSSGSFTVSVTVTSANVTIRAAKLRSPIVNLFWTLSGPSTNVVLNGDATRTLVPGTYQITVTNAEPYGTFTVDMFGQVVNPTGRLTASGATVDFDLAQLARVVVAVEHLSSDPTVGLLLGIGVSNLVRGTSPFFYLPPNMPGLSHTVTTRGGDGRFGTFRVNPDLSFGTTTGAVIVSSGPSGPQVDFDLTALTTVHLPAAADLWSPDEAASLPFGITELISKVDNVLATPTIYLPPSSTPSVSYSVRVLTGARFGTFRIENDGSVSAATAGLQFNGLGPREYQMNFLLAGLPSVEFRLGSLSQPFHPVRLAFPSDGAVFSDTTLALPPNPTGGTYQVVADRAVASGAAPSLGTLTVRPDFSLAATGALRVGADGRTVSVDACQLNGLRIAPNPGFRWWLGLSGGSAYTADNSASGTPTTIFMPDGTYTVFFQGDGSITVTLAGGALVSATPSLSVAGGSVASAICDNAAPVLSLPTDFSVAAASASGAIVSYSATATDAVDPAPVVSCAPASGSLFPIGTTSVTCTATDVTGNAASGSFTVTVSDQTPPTLTLPANITTPSTSAAGAVVNFSVSATDAIDPAPMIACSAVSGATFPIGLTTVSCTATDFAGNVTSGSFTVSVTVTSASVTIKGSRLRANGAAEFLWKISGPSTALSRNGDATLTLVPGTYQVTTLDAQPYGTFAVDSFGQVGSVTGALTATGTLVDFDLGALSGVAIPAAHLTTDITKGSAVLALSAGSSLVTAANGIYYLPASLPAASYLVSLRAGFVLGRFRVRANQTLEDMDLTDPLIVVEDGSGPGGGGRLDFDLARLFPFTFPYAMTDFGDPDSAGRVISVAIANAAGFNGPATVYLPATPANSAYAMAIRGGAGVYGTFKVAADLTPQQPTGAIRFDATNNFYLDFNAMLPVTLRVRQLADPFVALNVPIREAVSAGGSDFTVYLPPSNTNPAFYDLTTVFGTSFGRFTIGSDLALQATGALRVGADGRTISFDTCALTGLHIAPAPSRLWKVAISNTSGLYAAGTSSVRETTLFLPDGTYPVFFTDGSSITATLAGGAITAASPGLTVSGGSVSLGSCDNQPPVISGMPSDLTREASGPSGAIVTWEAPDAVDAAEGPVSVSCLPISGSTFSLGTTSVTCAATDSRGNGASASFSVTVQDTTPPLISGTPSDQIREATGPSGAIVSWDEGPSATDLVDGSIPVTCSPASGSMFSLGTTPVTCTATDSRGNAASAGFNVTVRDTTPPTLVVPADVLVAGTSAAGAIVNYAASATDAIDPAPSIACSPAPGSTFGFGLTTVLCTARDATGNSAAASFTVRVVYGFDGFKSPIANDGSSIFKTGRTVPVKFLLYAGASLTGAATATIQVFRILSDVTGTQEIETSAAGDSNTDNLFRWDGQQYIYNLTTTGYATGTYLIRASVSDGTVHEVRVSVR